MRLRHNYVTLTQLASSCAHLLHHDVTATLDCRVVCICFRGYDFTHKLRDVMKHKVQQTERKQNLFAVHVIRQSGIVY